MTEKLFTNIEKFYLPHNEMLRLRKAGLLNLGLNNQLATSLANNKIGPKKTTALLAYHFWTWVAFLVFIYSIYLSFTDRWWYFIIGTGLLHLIHTSNKKGNVENYLDAAMIDKDFYDQILGMNGWMYKIKESELENLKNYL